VATDGSIITPSGFVFKSTFAICNDAKCTKKDETNETVDCGCQELVDQWTLSPVPKATLESLTTKTRLLSTFTTVNTAGFHSITCNGSQWADCYGAVCTKDESTGDVTCDCPLSQRNPGKWIKYVQDCTEENCSGLVSVAPIFEEGSASASDFFQAVEQAGEEVPALPEPCTESASSTGAAAAAGEDCDTSQESA
jgi:hypothetical protein